MNEPVFNVAYASAYDDLYRGKDYRAECDVLEALFQQYSARPVRKILDLGCGTGNHANPLAERGYEVVGVDRSKHMLDQAKNKADETGLSHRTTFHCADIRALVLHETFDAAIMMFAVLGYQIENDDVAAALRTVRAHLSDGGLFVFDVWFGPAVLVQRPGDRVLVQKNGGETIIRTGAGALDANMHTCNINYRLWRLSGDRVLEQTEETHRMRFFFPKELDYMLQCAGLRLMALRAFPDAQCEPDEATWNVVGTAQPA